MKPKHTPGPWSISADQCYVIAHTETDAVDVARVYSGSAYDKAPRELKEELNANAARIVACVNACEGIEDPSVVPEMLNTLKYARDHLLILKIKGVQTVITDLNAILARLQCVPWVGRE